MARPIIIDTDPGADDAVAILLALASPEIALLGLSTVAGNVALDLTSANARRICELAQRPEIPVFAGCPRPLLLPLVTADAVHGRTGLDGATLRPVEHPPESAHAVDWLVDTLCAAEDASITLVPIAPQTNLALAMVKEPRILPKIREIVFMGGSYREGGNIAPAAEFNMYVDPHAAHVVLTSGVPLTMIPLDCTHKARIPRDWLEQVRGLGTTCGRFVADLLGHYERHDMEAYGETAGPLHDPCTIAYLLHPEWFGGRDCAVWIDTTGPHSRGQTVVDWWGKTGALANVRVINHIDAGAFFGFLFERLSTLP